MAVIQCGKCGKSISDIFPMHDCVPKEKGKAKSKGKKFKYTNEGWMNPAHDIQKGTEWTEFYLRYNHPTVRKTCKHVRITIEEI